MQTVIYKIPTALLFQTLNANRQAKGKARIEESLLTFKLGTLLSFKTDDYINFKDEFINLEENLLTTLQDIIIYYFEVDISTQLRAFAITPECVTVDAKSPKKKKGLKFFS